MGRGGGACAGDAGVKRPPYLLDSHTLLWATSEPHLLSPRVRAIIADPAHRLLLSTATLWELSIKVTIGKLELPKRFFDEIFELGYESLSVESHHLDTYRNLPLTHRDPFDRLLVAQAVSERLCLLSSDKLIQQYEVEWLW